MATPLTKDANGQLCVPCLIQGKQIIQPADANFPVTSARTQEVLHHGQTATIDIAIQAVESAAATFKTYRKTRADERRELLLKAADLFDSRAKEAMDRQMSETSCDEHWAQFNISSTSSMIRETATAIRAALTGELPPTHSGVPQLVYKEPVGPVLIIAPWNGALVLGARGISSALAAGCTVVFKASELCPWTHSILVEVFMEAGFPPGSVNMIMADRPSGPRITEAIIAHPDVRKIEFIGSGNVGKAVGAMAAKHLKPISLELGDQSPAIVLEDANLAQAADLCAVGALLLHGQVCFGTERIIVLSSIKDEFCQILADAMKNKPISGCAATKAFAERSKALIDDALERGAGLIYGNNELVGPASLSPSILINVDPESAISKGEAFAPTVFVVAVDSDEKAIAEANSREGGLSASIFTTNQERGWRMSRELDFGLVQINNMTSFVEPGGPQPCWKASGWGSQAGRYGIECFLQHKSVVFFPAE